MKLAELNNDSKIIEGFGKDSINENDTECSEETFHKYFKKTSADHLLFT